MTVGIIGFGYVGLPLAVAFAEARKRVINADVAVIVTAPHRDGLTMELV